MWAAVAAVFGVTPTYVSMLRATAREQGSVGLVKTMGRPVTLSATQLAQARSWAQLISVSCTGAGVARRTPGRKKALAEIWGAEDKQHALAAVQAFDSAHGAKFPKAVAKITEDVEELLAFL